LLRAEEAFASAAAAIISGEEDAGGVVSVYAMLYDFVSIVWRWWLTSMQQIGNERKGEKNIFFLYPEQERKKGRSKEVLFGTGLNVQLKSEAVENVQDDNWAVLE
jgi:hypothetical protein